MTPLPVETSPECAFYMLYDPKIIEETAQFMASARKQGLANERKSGANSGGGLSNEQRMLITETAKAADGLYLDESVKATLLERFTMWSEHHGNKVEDEKLPYILRQLVEEYMKNDGWAQSGYDGKVGATIRGAIVERNSRLPPIAPSRHKSATSKVPVIEKVEPIPSASAEEADKFMQDVRTTFKHSGHTLRGTANTIPAALAKAVEHHADSGNFNKFTLRHLLATFGKMAARAEIPLSDSMAAAVLPKLAQELKANKAFLGSEDTSGLIPLTVKEGDVSALKDKFPFLCEKAPHVVRKAVLQYPPAEAHLHKVMEYFGQTHTGMPEDTRIYNADARAVAERRHEAKTARQADSRATSGGPAVKINAESMLPSWLSPAAPTEDAATHLGRVIQGDWSKHNGRSGGRKK